MAIFNRGNKANNNKPVSKDVQKYYKSGKRERVGLAWLVAFASLVLTIAVIMGLFFGGRWIYRQIAGDDKPTQPTSQQANNDPAEESTPSSDQNNQPSNNQPSTPSGTSSTSTQTPSTSTPPPANTGKLNSTGPEHNVAIFAAVSVIGALLHNRYLRRRAHQT